MIITILLALQMGMSDSAYQTARERVNPTVIQAEEVVTEAIRREAYGDSVILHTNGAKRTECIIGLQEMTCVRATITSADHYDFDSPSVTEGDSGNLPIAAIVAAERAWVGLSPL